MIAPRRLPRSPCSLLALAARQRRALTRCSSALSPSGAPRSSRRPTEVAFFFSEPVEASFGAIRVFDAEGEQVETGEIVRPERQERCRRRRRCRGDLADGTYTATYRVISADSHPVSGGFVFTVGEPGAGPAESVSELLDESDVGAVT